MKHLRLALIIVIMTMAYGCGIPNHLTSNLNQISTNVILSENNYSIVGSVETELSSTYILGIGGLSKKALYTNAMSELSRKANLTGSQALINVSLSTHIEVAWILWRRYTIIAHGTIIEFHDKGIKGGTPTKHRDERAENPKPIIRTNLEGVNFNGNTYNQSVLEIEKAIESNELERADQLLSNLIQWYNNLDTKNEYVEEDISSLQNLLEKKQKKNK